MITVKTNITDVIGKLVAQLQVALDKENVGRAVAIAMVPEVQHRIHVDGLAADGSQIGNYKPSYLRIRAKRYGTDPKVILSFTRQMQNAFTALVGSDRKWGLGWHDDLNFNKSQYMEEHFGKKIWALTASEQDSAKTIAENYLNKAFDAFT